MLDGKYSSQRSKSVVKRNLRKYLVGRKFQGAINFKLEFILILKMKLNIELSFGILQKYSHVLISNIII